METKRGQSHGSHSYGHFLVGISGEHQHCTLTPDPLSLPQVRVSLDHARSPLARGLPLLAGHAGADFRDHVAQLCACRVAAARRAHQLPPGGAAAAPAASSAARPGAGVGARSGHAAQLRQLLLPCGGARAAAQRLRAGRQLGQPARQPLPHPGGRRVRDHAGVRAPAAAAAAHARRVPQDVGGAAALAALPAQRVGGAARTRGAGLAVIEQRFGLRLGVGLGRRRGRRGRGAGGREHAIPRPASGARRVALGLAAAVPRGRQQDLLLPGQPQHARQQQTQPGAAHEGQAGLGAPLRPPASPAPRLQGERRPPTGEGKGANKEIKIFLFSIKGKKYNKMFYFHFSKKNCLIILANGKDVFIGKLFICNILIYSFGKKKRNNKKK